MIERPFRSRHDIPLLGVDMSARFTRVLPSGGAIIFLDGKNLEYNGKLFWWLFDMTLSQLLAHVNLRKSKDIINRAIFQNEKVTLKADELEQKISLMLPKARRAFGKERVMELFEIRTKYFNLDSPLMQHFCRWVANSEALDDVYNATGCFKFGDDIVSPAVAEADWIAWFHLSCPNAQAVRNRYRIVARLFSELGGGETLSIACGSAQPLIHATREMWQANGADSTKLFLTDVSNESLNLAMQKAKHAGVDSLVSVANMPFQELHTHFNGRQFDIVEACGILDYLPDQYFVQLIQGALSLTKKNGHILVSNMAKTRAAQLLSNIYNWEILYRTPEELVALLEKAGAKNIKVYVDPWGIHPVAVATH